MTTLLKQFRNRRAAAETETGGDLLPLTAEYLPEQHRVYAAHLDAALANPELRNIALTGRYGAGKSSVLDETQRRHKRRVLRVSLSNLGADEGGESLTNRIEKEFVKQLLHREPPHRVPQSRFRRISTRSFSTSFLFTLFQVGVVVGVVWLLGGKVDLKPIHGDQRWWVPASAWAGLVVGVVLLLTWVRLAARDHVVSQFSAAGASVTLTKSDSTYFDEFLDEIVYFFARVKVDIVILEDLDRFNDPHIFQALRELNTVLNSSTQIRYRLRRRRIRFIYAIRDSVFERLGQESYGTSEADECATPIVDAVDAELVLANRTKFFDIVIPLVPFITHYNARDLLERLMTNEPAKVSGELIDLVARRLPDMRLLTNIRNEYAVFAHRLIVNKAGVGDLRPDSLFAMVVYKNVHLRDFEQALLGKSNLDKLDQARHDLVRTAIALCESRIREIHNGTAAKTVLRARLQRFREQLEWLVGCVDRANQQGTHSGYVIDDVVHSIEAAETVDFWEKLIATSRPWAIAFTSYGSRRDVPMHREDFEKLVVGELDLQAWTARATVELEREKTELEGKLAQLRHADFVTLLGLSEFTLGEEGMERTFAALVDELLSSTLAIDLIAEGHIDPYYGVYISQYYGGRVSAKAMKFLMKNVDKNSPEIHADLNQADVEAILRETNGSFLNDLSGYNTNILDYLLAGTATQPLADVLLGHITSRSGDFEHEFLNSYLAGGRQQNAAIEWLTRNWTGVFTFLIRDAQLDTDSRVKFLSAALLSVEAGIPYALDEDVRAFLGHHYGEIDAITGDHPEAVTVCAADLLDKAGFVCGDLERIGAAMREQLVAAGRYTLTAANLKAATGATTIGLDTLRANNAEVYADVLVDPAAYLAAFDADDDTAFTITDPAAFADILNDLAVGENDDADVDAPAVSWSWEDIDTVVARSAPSCRVTNLIVAVKVPLWPALARTLRFDASLTNVHAYITQIGPVDTALAGLLVQAGAVDCTAEHPDGAESDDADCDESAAVTEMKMRVGRAVLNAGSTIPAADVRTHLVQGMTLRDYLHVTELNAEHGRLLALLIEREICDDTATTFAHFPCEDWETLRPAILTSAGFAEFFDPSLIDEAAVEHIFTDAGIPDAVADKVLDSLEAYTPTGSCAALLAAGRYALRKSRHLAPHSIERMATATHAAEVIVGLLALLDEAEIAATEIEKILIQLDGNYVLLSQAGKKFDLPHDPSHRTLLSRLKADGRVASFRQRTTARDKVAVTTRE